MAAKRHTEWHAFSSTYTLTGASVGEANVLDTTDIAPPATIIRIIGSVIVSLGRTNLVTSTNQTEAAHARMGVMVQYTRSSTPEDMDMSSDAVLSDDRWLWCNQCRLDATSEWRGYWNGAAQVDRFANIPDSRSQHFPIDIRAKRRWTDPAMLSVHHQWSVIANTPSDISFRWMLRVLFAMH